MCIAKILLCFNFFFLKKACTFNFKMWIFEFSKTKWNVFAFLSKNAHLPCTIMAPPNLRETNFVTHNVIRWGLFVKFCRNDSHHNDPWPLLLFPKKEMDKTLHNCYLDVFFFVFLWFKWQYYLVGKKKKKRVKLASSTLTTPSCVTILFLVCNSFSILFFFFFFFRNNYNMLITP